MTKYDAVALAVVLLTLTMWLFATPILAFLTSLSMLILFAVAIAMMIGLVYLAFYLYLSLHKLRNLSASESLQQQHEQLKLLKLHYQIEQEAAKAQQQLVKVEQERAKLMRTVQHVLNPGQRLILGGPDGIQLLDGAPQIATTRPTAPNVIKSNDNDQLAFATGEQWINDFLFDANGKLRIHHVSVNGPTRSGKTWLLLNFIWRMQQPHPEADYFLIDPKYEGSQSGWPFTPFVTDFDEVPEAMNYIYNNVVKVRKLAMQQDKPIPYPAFVCIDEFDGCSAEHGRDFLKPVSRGVKEGASGGTHYMAVGQSTLIGDIGGNGALYRNMGRVILGTEGLAFINNSQFIYRGMKPEKRTWERQLYYLQEHGRRYGLIVPPSSNGLPFVAEIPMLQKPLFKARNDHLTPPLSYVGEGEKNTPLLSRRGAGGEVEPSEGEKPPMDEQLAADLATVRANMDKLEYHERNGKLNVRSVARILGFDYGPHYHRAEKVAKLLKNER